MQVIRNISLTAMLLMLVSCVTINIYFPEAAAERAADIIIDDVWGKREQKVPAEPEASLKQIQATPVAMQLLNWVISPAQAAANLDISSPAITSLQGSMRSRHGKLKPYYANGAVGLTANGLVAVRDAKAVALKDRNKVKALVASENKDRNALYAEIARANGHPEWLSQIRTTFAARWVSKAAGGWWVKSGGKWKQK